MARLPELQPRNTLSQVAPQRLGAGATFGMLAELMGTAASIVKPLAMETVRAEGENSVYRDASGALRVDLKNLLGGELAAQHNAAAMGAYLGQLRVDMDERFSVMQRDFEFDPAGFKSAATAYADEIARQAPGPIRSDVRNSLAMEAQQRFNGLQAASINRSRKQAETNTALARDRIAADAISIYQQSGDTPAYRAKLEELEGINRYRANAPFIAETPEETDSYMRGVVGNAQAAGLIRELTDLQGAREVPQDVRDRAEEVLKSNDISPAQRERLYAATQGRFKEVDANAIVYGLTSDAFADKVVRRESSGDANAANPNSSALGPHQFLKGTWRDTVTAMRREGQAKWADGLSESQLQALRTDRSKSREVFEYLRAQNAAVLSRNGLPVNEATEYLAHFLGAGDAVRVIQKAIDPDAKVSDILSDDVIAANMFLKDMSARELLNWSARQMTVKASDIAAMREQIAGIDDTEVQAHALQRLNVVYQDRRSVEAGAYDEYTARIGNGDFVSSQEILEDHRLSDTGQVALVEDLRKSQADALEIAQAVAGLTDPTVFQNPYDGSQNKAIDKAFDAVVSGGDPLTDPRAMAFAGEVSDSRGRLPTTMFEAMRGAVHTGDPRRVAAAMEFGMAVTDQQSGAISTIDGSTDFLKEMDDYRFYSQFMDAEAAAQRVIDIRSPEVTRNIKNLSDEAKRITAAIQPEEVIEAFDESGILRGAPVLGDDVQRGEIMGEYRKLVFDNYVETGDAELSKSRAAAALKRIYGVSPLAGDRIMKFPPERAYMAIGGSHDWMTRQIQSEATIYFQGEIGTGNRIDISDIRIVSDDITRKEFTSGTPPSYRVYVNRNGALEAIKDRYYFDPKPYQMTGREFEAARARYRETEAAAQARYKEFEQEATQRQGDMATTVRLREGR